MKNLRIACFVLALTCLLLFFGRFVFPIQKPPVYLIVLSIGLSISTIVVTVILARKLNRSGFGWGVFSFFLPWLSGLIIAFLGESQYKSRGDYSYSGGSRYGSTFLADKSCSACGRSVSFSSSAGQSCPHCGAYWSVEREIKR